MLPNKLNYMTVRRVIRSTPYQQNLQNSTLSLIEVNAKFRTAYRRLCHAVTLQGICTVDPVVPVVPLDPDVPNGSPSSAHHIADAVVHEETVEASHAESPNRVERTPSFEPHRHTTDTDTTEGRVMNKIARNQTETSPKPWLARTSH